MSAQTYIFDVSESNFQQSVLDNSTQLPVVVTFMDVSTGPSNAVSYIFESLAKEFKGQFIFARVDVYEQPELRQQYDIQNVPCTLIFQNGQLMRREEGQLNDDEARSILDTMDIYRESDRLRLQAREQHLAGDTQQAILLLTDAIQKDPQNLRVAMDMVQVFIDIKEYEQARALFARLPESVSDTEMGASLKQQLTFIGLAEKTAGLEALKAQLAQEPGDHEARFDLAVCLVAAYQYESAMDNLLMIVEQEPEFKEGGAREFLSLIANMVSGSDPELAQHYRRKMANILAS